MKRSFSLALAFALLVYASVAQASGLHPWKFGMSKEEVTSFSGFGPYRSFSNGDVETFNGVFDGRKYNVQFFFNQKGLNRIGVYVYEGQNLDDAMAAWEGIYSSLVRMYGSVEIPGLSIPATSGPLTALDISALRRDAEKGHKVQMAPVAQPNDMFVYASLMRGDTKDGVFYYLVIFHDPR